MIQYVLSLNAAIEAARETEAGKGFAVVAGEISKFEDQTVRSIRDIESRITMNNLIQSYAPATEEVASSVNALNSVSMLPESKVKGEELSGQL